MKNTSLIFDLDGTLIDTAPDLVATLNHVLSLKDIAPLPYEIGRQTIGYGARRMIMRGLEVAGVSMTETTVSEMFDIFIEHYSANIATNSAAFQGVIEAIEHYRTKGWLCGICTNKREDLAVKLIKELKLHQHFDIIKGGDSYPVYKPDPGHLLGTIRDMNGAPEHAIMVGDSEADIMAAHNANIPVIAVSFGYSPVPVTDFKPTAIIDDYAQFSEAVERILPGA